MTAIILRYNPSDYTVLEVGQRAQMAYVRIPASLMAQRPPAS